MNSWSRFLVGLAVALTCGWISHGPIGRGEAFVGRLEAQAEQVIRATELPGVRVRFERDPLRRSARLSGEANEFQREGQGLYPGLNDRILAIPGVSGLVWDERACCAPEEGER